MSDAYVLDLARSALTTALLVGGPILGLSLVTGVVVGLFQAATQVNEATLNLVPKLVVVLLAALFFGPWMLTTLVNFTRGLLLSLPNLVR